MKILILSVLLTVTMPSLYVDGRPLIDRPLAVLIYDADTNQIVTGDWAMPGERKKVWYYGEGERFYATAKIIETQIESTQSNTATKSPEYKCGDGCHQ